MLSHFFETQYNFPAQDDWTVEARKNLNEFGISENLQYIGGHSKETFKIIVKKQARIYAYNLFIQKKEGHSKLKNLDYQELKTQDYLLCQEMTVIQAKILLKFRTRMANFSNNYKGNTEVKECKQCKKHPDSQDMIYECEYNKKYIQMSGKYEDIFEVKIEIKMAKMLEEISKSREKFQ